MKKLIGVKMLFVLAVAAVIMLGASMSHAAKSFEGTVNINTASADQLMELPGIGPSKAKAIVEYRTANPFKAVDEIKEVKGIGDKLFAKISNHLTVSGQTRLGNVSAKQPGGGGKAKK